MKLLLSPHHDDETLFAAYTLLREKPLVAVCFAGAPRHGRHEIRARETTEAMRVLGCEWADYTGDERLEQRLSLLDPEWVWAPLPEQDGHSQHNQVGELAHRLWPNSVTFYATYTMGGGKTIIGDRVETEPGWEDLKLQALNCYRSQLARRGTRPHFERGLDEYLVVPQLVAA